MPRFSIETNQKLVDAGSSAFVKQTSAFVTELLGKPESYVMICLKPKKL
jgi:hypothetical protein